MTSVLVVDDRPDVRLSFLYMLQACGYEVAEAADGERARAYLDSNHVDVMLTDLYMHGMDGPALIETVRARAIAQPRIIVMTGSARLTDSPVKDARDAGADAVLLKPLTREKLVSTIDTLLERR